MGRPFEHTLHTPEHSNIHYMYHGSDGESIRTYIGHIWAEEAVGIHKVYSAIHHSPFPPTSFSPLHHRYYGGKGLPFFWTTLDGAATANGEVAKQAFSIHKTMGTYGKYLIPLHVGAAGAHAVRGQAIFARINPFR